jgi:hypothetical protein
MPHFAGPAEVDITGLITQLKDSVFIRNRRDRNDLPGLSFEIQDSPDQIIRMQTLHDNHDGAVPLVIEVGAERADVELPAPLCLGQSARRL